MTRQRTLTNSTNSSLTDLATDYATAVVSGAELAGPDIRHACQRHLQDVATGNRRGILWNVSAAQRAIRFFSSVLKLNGGIYRRQAVSFTPLAGFYRWLPFRLEKQ